MPGLAGGANPFGPEWQLRCWSLPGVQLNLRSHRNDRSMFLSGEDELHRFVHVLEKHRGAIERRTVR
jgi:hypothetical protein